MRIVAAATAPGTIKIKRHTDQVRPAPRPSLVLWCHRTSRVDERACPLDAAANARMTRSRQTVQHGLQPTAAGAVVSRRGSSLTLPEFCP
jgi:hypothetical protein